ncbi:MULTISPECIES: nuclear transport factor 2 family protein [Maricaulis]|nr:MULTISPECIES: hypothetical protein [Maricaulis]
MADYLKTPGRSKPDATRPSTPPPNFALNVARVLQDGADMFIHSVHEVEADGDVWVTMSMVRRDRTGPMTVKRQVSARFTASDGYCAVSSAADPDPNLENEGALNKAQVSAFIRMVVRDGGVEHRDAFIDRGRFVSHSPGACCRPEGYDALVDRRRPRPGLTYHGVDEMVGEGPYVAVFSCFDMDGATYRACDLLRLEDGRIVEHWDVIEEVASHSVAHNDET